MGIGLYLSGKIRTVKKLYFYFFVVNYLKIRNKILATIIPETKNYDFVIIDDSTPKYITGFKDYEFSGFLRTLQNVALFSIIGDRVNKLKHYDYYPIKNIHEFETKKEEFIQEYKLSPEKVLPFFPWTKVNAKLAYVVFLANGIYLIDYLEQREIKFVLELYPGGSFSLVAEGEPFKILKRVLGSTMLEKVIVNQVISRDFLLENNVCPKHKIAYLHGGFLSPDLLLAPDKTIQYPRDKPTIDICFAAAKYMPRGENKGYDLFIEMAHILLEQNKVFRFHIVGGHGENDIPIKPEFRQYFQFYGILKNREFTQFYEDKDIFICPLRPYLLGKGIFDGFPTGTACEAGLHALCLVMSDPLKQNVVFKSKDSAIFLDNNVADFTNSVLNLAANPDLMYAIGRQGKADLRAIYQHKAQFDFRYDIINECLGKG